MIILIYNAKLKVEIIFDTKADWIQFTPKHYEEIPHITIEMKEFDFHWHSLSCNDCKQFIDSLGSDSLNWIIGYDNNVYRLDLKNFGIGNYPRNQLTSTHLSEYNSGTRLTLRFSDIPIDKNKMIRLLKEAEKVEDYEKACKLRDLINE